GPRLRPHPRGRRARGRSTKAPRQPPRHALGPRRQGPRHRARGPGGSEMTRLEALYARARAEGRKVLNVFLCVGDPSLDESLELALAAIEAGAEVLELGVPFRDPVADGETIAKAA